jgi:hypothetical protein
LNTELTLTQEEIKHKNNEQSKLWNFLFKKLDVEVIFVEILHQTMLSSFPSRHENMLAVFSDALHGVRPHVQTVVPYWYQ